MRRAGRARAEGSTLALVLVLVLVLASPLVFAKPTTTAPAAALPPLAILPSVARVKIVSHGSAIAVIEEVNLPRGEWKGEALHFHVAFGAPGPKAIDAHLVPVGDGALEAEDDEVGEALTTERVPRRPPNAYALLGRESMAGIVVHIRSESLTKAFARGGNMASLRIRSVADAAEQEAGAAAGGAAGEKGASVVVRLGASRGTPLTLGRITASAAPPATPLLRAEAKLCGPDADPHPLAIGIVPKPTHAAAPGTTAEPTIAPVLAVRHPSDDLCVRLAHAPK